MTLFIFTFWMPKFTISDINLNLQSTQMVESVWRISSNNDAGLLCSFCDVSLTFLTLCMCEWYFLDSYRFAVIACWFIFSSCNENVRGFRTVDVPALLVLPVFNCATPQHYAERRFFAQMGWCYYDSSRYLICVLSSLNKLFYFMLKKSIVWL